MIYLTFLAAFLLSAISAYYSVLGLTAIFMGAFWPVVFMGSALEFSKLVTASWLYRNWKTAPFLLRTYLTIAVVLLMLITSMGIFGFLSKSHIDSTLNAGANSIELKTLNTQQKIAEDKLTYLLARAKDPSTASNRLDKQIQDVQKELKEINTKRLPLLKEENKLSADIGPIKYVADIFFSGDNAVDSAVRLVIFIIMLVFDPLAVLLLIAGNISLKEKNEIANNGRKNSETDETVHEETRVQEDDRDAGEKIPEKVQVDKENIATIQENPESNESQEMQKIVTQHGPGKYTEEYVPVKKLEPKYDYTDVFTFRQKDKK